MNVATAPQDTLNNNPESSNGVNQLVINSELSEIIENGILDSLTANKTKKTAAKNITNSELLIFFKNKMSPQF